VYRKKNNESGRRPHYTSPHCRDAWKKETVAGSGTILVQVGHPIRMLWESVSVRWLVNTHVFRCAVVMDDINPILFSFLFFFFFYSNQQSQYTVRIAIYTKWRKKKTPKQNKQNKNQTARGEAKHYIKISKDSQIEIVLIAFLLWEWKIVLIYNCISFSRTKNKGLVLLYLHLYGI